jgi:hypothetical protein
MATDALTMASRETASAIPWETWQRVDLLKGSRLVNRFSRMYKKGTLTKEQISERVAKGSISADEYEYITGEKFSGGDTE